MVGTKLFAEEPVAVESPTEGALLRRLSGEPAQALLPYANHVYIQIQ